MSSANTLCVSVLMPLIVKVNTVAQFSVLIGSLAHFVVGFPSMAYLEPLWYLTAVTTVTSGLGYLNGSGLNRKNIFARKK